MTLYQGTITGFMGSWGSGIANLLINGLPVLCENAPGELFALIVIGKMNYLKKKTGLISLTKVLSR